MRKINIFFSLDDALVRRMVHTGDDTELHSFGLGLSLYSDTLKKNATEARTRIDALYAKVDELSGDEFTGEVMNAIKAKCYEYKYVLEAYADLLEALSLQTSDISKESETVQSKIESLCSGGGN